MKTKSKYGPRDATAYHGFTILHSCSPVQAWGADNERGDCMLNVWQEPDQVRLDESGRLQVNVFDRNDRRVMDDGRSGQGARARHRHVARIANGQCQGFVVFGKRGAERKGGVRAWVATAEEARRLYVIEDISEPDANGVRWATLLLLHDNELYDDNGAQS